MKTFIQIISFLFSMFGKTLGVIIAISFLCVITNVCVGGPQWINFWGINLVYFAIIAIGCTSSLIAGIFGGCLNVGDKDSRAKSFVNFTTAFLFFSLLVGSLTWLVLYVYNMIFSILNI